MDQHLQFRIGTTFNGEGFTKLQQTVKGVNQPIRAATGAATQLSGALAGLDTGASKAMGAMTGLFNAFAQGGVQGLVISGAMIAFNAYVTHLKEELEEAQKRTEALKKSVMDSINSVTSEIKGKFAKEIDEINTKFDLITKNAVAFTNAMTGLSGSQSAGNIVNLEIEKYNAMLEAATEAERKNVEATYNLEIAKEKERSVAESAAAKVENAVVAREQAEQKLAAIGDERVKLAAELARVEQSYEESTDATAEARKKIKELLVDLRGKEEKLGAQELQTRENIKVLRIQEQTAIQEETNATAKAALETKKASDAIVQLAEKSRKMGFEVNEFVDAFEKERAADAAKELADAQREESKLLQESSKTQQELTEAKRQLAEAIRNYEDNIARNEIWNVVSNDAKLTGVNGLWKNLNASDTSKMIQEATADVAVKRGLADGSIRTVDQLNKVTNAAMREARQQISSPETMRQIQEAERAERIRNMSEKARSKADQDFLDKFDAVAEANNRAQAEKDAAKMREMFARWREEDNHENIKKIREKLEKLGLK